MKAKELIKILEAVDPESNVGLAIGRYGDDEYRKMCAKAELEKGDCLNFLQVDCVAIHKSDDDGQVWADIILVQNNVCDLSEVAKSYDLKHGTKEDAALWPATDRPSALAGT